MTEPEETEEVEGAEHLGDAGKKALDDLRLRLKTERARVKELEPLAAKAREADEATKTEIQKATEARAAVERERDEARAELLRVRVAAAEGLPADMAVRLRGSTEEELKADAKELLKLLRPTTQQTSARPVAALQAGALPGGAEQSPTTPDDWIRAEARRNK